MECCRTREKSSCIISHPKEPMDAHRRGLTVLSLVLVRSDRPLSSASTKSEKSGGKRASPTAEVSSFSGIRLPHVSTTAFSRLLMFGFLCSLVQKHYETDAMSGHGIWGDPSLCSWSRGSTLPSLDLLRLLHVCLEHIKSGTNAHTQNKYSLFCVVYVGEGQVCLRPGWHVEASELFLAVGSLSAMPAPWNLTFDRFYKRR